MSDENPSMMSHVSIGTNDFPKAVAFYDKVMATIGVKRVHEVDEVDAIAYGKVFPEFWVAIPHDGGKAEVANGVHFAFMAPSKEKVHDFWDAAISAGAEPDGEPGPRPHYGQPYYGCFVRDLDGHKIECMYWDADLEGS